MKFTWAFCILILFLIFNLSECRKNAISKAFTSNKIVPDVVDAAPTKTIQIRYTQSKKHVNRGNELAPKDVKIVPQISHNFDPRRYYTLVMVDPDVPSRQNATQRSILHWMIVNIPGSLVTSGETITEYIGSGPKENTGLHRYVFLLFKQRQKLTFDEPYRNSTHGSTRSGFSVKNFASKYNLRNPIAGNFFKAQYDDSVPALYQQLTS